MDLHTRGVSKTFANGVQVLKDMTLESPIESQRQGRDNLLRGRFGSLCDL